MKKCNRCSEIKPFTGFSRNGKNSYRSYCKPCLSIYTYERFKPTADYVNAQKIECSVCGYDRCKKALEFHHLDETTKSFTIGSFVARRMWSIETKRLIDEEIKKCVLLCANCHRELHEGMISL